MLDKYYFPLTLRQDVFVFEIPPVKPVETQDGWRRNIFLGRFTGIFPYSMICERVKYSIGEFKQQARIAGSKSGEIMRSRATAG